MNSNIQVFNYQDFTVRTFTDTDGEVWLVAKDVCAVLGIADAHTAIRDLDDDEKGRQDMPTPGGMQSMTVIFCIPPGVGISPTPLSSSST